MGMGFYLNEIEIGIINWNWNSDFGIVNNLNEIEIEFGFKIRNNWK